MTKATYRKEHLVGVLEFHIHLYSVIGYEVSNVDMTVYAMCNLWTLNQLYRKPYEDKNAPNLSRQSL